MVFAVSAKTFVEDRKLALQKGCDAFLEKPLQTDKLLELLQTHLNLLWQYDPSSMGGTTSAEALDGLNDWSMMDFTGPDPMQAELLHDLIMRGDIVGVEELLQQLEASGLTLFVKKIRPFVNPLQKKILRHIANFYIK